jgi:two-component system chemotaxis response regulator CheY
MTKQIAIIDDSNTITNLKKSLRPLEITGNYSFTYFTSPLDFCGKIKADFIDFDFFFLNVNTPTMSGVEITKFLRSTPKYTSTLIYALTTEECQKIQEEAIAAGVNGWIIKLTTPGMVREQIQRALKNNL